MDLNRRLGGEVERVEVPDYFEGIPLRRGYLLAGWILGLASSLAGIGMMVTGEGTAIEALGVILAATGCLVIFGLVRCRRFEIEIGRRWVKVGAGPLAHRFPTEMLGSLKRRPARSWRRLYGGEELRLGLRAGSREVIVPSHDPQETVNALEKGG